jgi:rSAM/selenodomain-associated transferase 1
VNNNLVIIFVKEPKLGFIKTRLAKHTSDDFVLELYKVFVKDIVNILKGNKFDFVLCAYSNLELVNETFGNYNNFLQSDGNLGEKMKNAILTKLKQGYKKVILIGSDIPTISSNLLYKGFDKLNNCDCVLGKCEDGGYYLIGFNYHSFNATIFENISWSTSNVLRQTLNKLNNNKVILLDKLNDIDTIEDLKNFYITYKNSRLENSYTIKYLKRSNLWNNIISTIKAHKILATRRVPNIKVDLEKSGVIYNEQGIKID